MKNDNNKYWVNSVPFQLLKWLLSFVLAMLLSVIIFAIITDSEEQMDKCSKLIFIVGVALTLLANFIIDFNAIQKLKYKIQQSEADIKSAKELNESLLDKAERVSNKFMMTESELYNNFADARKSGSAIRIRNCEQFKGVVESYPEMKSNEAIQKLLSQIERTESTIYSEKKLYSQAVANFNTRIHTFPIVLIRWMCGWKDIAIKFEDEEEAAEDIVSDEELGI